MSEDTNTVLKDLLTEEQMRALLEIEKTTHQSVSSLIREGIEMYIEFMKSEAARRQELAIFSPIVFDRPYRNRDDQDQ